MYGEEASKLARETKRTQDHFPPYNDSLVRSIIREMRHLHDICLQLHLKRKDDQARLQQEFHEQVAEITANATAVAAAAIESQELQDPSSSSLSTTINSPPKSNLGSGSGSIPFDQQAHQVNFARQQQQLSVLFQNKLQDVERIYFMTYKVHQVPLERNKRILMVYHAQRLEKIKEFAWSFQHDLDQSLQTLLSPTELKFFKDYSQLLVKDYSDQFPEIDLSLAMTLPPKDIFITIRVLKECGEIMTDSGTVLNLKKNSEHFVKRSDVERLILQGYLQHVP